MRRSTAGIAGLAVLLLAGACQPQAPDGSAARPPADAPKPPPAMTPGPPAPPAFQGDFDLRGTEPFWVVSVRAREITVMRPDHLTLKAANHGPRMAGNQAVWATLAGEEPIVVVMVEQDCSDGMSDTAYAYAAELQVDGETLAGCAARATAK